MAHILLTAHNAASPDRGSFCGCAACFKSRSLRGDIVAAAHHHFKISVDIRTFKIRRHLERGPAAVRKTLVPISVAAMPVRLDVTRLNFFFIPQKSKV